MQARGADGHSGEQKVSDGFGCLLQCGHHLEMGIVNMAEEGILILYTGQKTVQKLLNVDLRTSRITSFKVAWSVVILGHFFDGPDGSTKFR